MSADATIARTVADYLRERLALVRWFRLNASVKHGIPLDEPPQPSPAEPQNVTNHFHCPRQEPLPAPAARDESTPPRQQAVSSAAPETPQSSWAQRAAPWLIGAATLGGGGAAGYALSQWTANEPPSASVTAPDVEVGLPCESPLQWLEDRGENRP